MLRYKKVLLVDDHSLIREGAALRLKSIDPTIEVLHASSVAEGKEVVRDEDPDLVFLDLRFDNDPRAGIGMLQWMKEDPRLDGIPVIVMSGEPLDRRAVEELLGEHAAGFLAKGKADSPDIFRLAMQSMEAGAVFIHGARTVTPAPVDGDVRPPPRTMASLGLNAVYQRVLELHVRGMPYKRIARESKLAEATVKEYVANMCRQFKVENAKSLIYEIARAGVVFDEAAGRNSGGGLSNGEASDA